MRNMQNIPEMVAITVVIIVTTVIVIVTITAAHAAVETTLLLLRVVALEADGLCFMCLGTRQPATTKYFLDSTLFAKSAKSNRARPLLVWSGGTHSCHGCWTLDRGWEAAVYGGPDGFTDNPHPFLAQVAFVC